MKLAYFLSKMLLIQHQMKMLPNYMTFYSFEFQSLTRIKWLEMYLKNQQNLFLMHNELTTIKKIFFCFLNKIIDFVLKWSSNEIRLQKKFVILNGFYSLTIGI